MRILVFGDSIGQGFYDEVNGGWVQRLQRDFFQETIEKKSDINIINLSVSGHTTQEVLARIETESRVRISDEKILTIIATGVNDTYERSGTRRTAETDFRRNIDLILNIAKSFGDVLVLGCTACIDDRTQPTSWDSNLHYTNDRLSRYSSILSKAASAADVPFLPLFEVMKKGQSQQETMPDGIHPNDVGHEIIYNEVKKKLEAML